MPKKQVKLDPHPHECITVEEISKVLKVLSDQNASETEKESARDFIYRRADNCSRCIRRLNKMIGN